MYINLFVRNMPLRLVQEIVRARVTATSRRCNVYIPYNTRDKYIELNSTWPINERLRSELGVFWSKPDLPVVEIHHNAFRENIIEQADEGHVPRFSLRRWGVQGSVSSMRRRLEEGEESSDNETRQERQVDMSQSVVSQPRTSGTTFSSREAILEMYRHMQRTAPVLDNVYVQQNATPPHIYPATPTRERPTAVTQNTSSREATRIVREAQDIRQRRARERQRMEENRIYF